MGFYDGVCGKASSHAVSLDVDCPVVLVVDCKGMSTSIGAVISGFLNFLSVDEVFHFLIPVSLGVGVGIGFLGSISTVRKHLHV